MILTIGIPEVNEEKTETLEETESIIDLVLNISGDYPFLEIPPSFGHRVAWMTSRDQTSR